MSKFLRRNEEILKHRNNLPHWQQEGAMQFVTFRLGDAMPQQKLKIWKEERDEWMRWNPKPWSKKTKAEFEKRFYAKLEQWLDEGAGSCLFRQEENRRILEEVLIKAEGKWAEHQAWVIMPNHVHLLFCPKMSLQDLVKIWKGVSARRIGKGAIWQKDYRDTMIRDRDHFVDVVRYIRRNPKGLREGEFRLWENEEARQIADFD